MKILSLCTFAAVVLPAIAHAGAPMAEPEALPPLPGSIAERVYGFQAKERPLIVPTWTDPNSWFAADFAGLPASAWRVTHHDVTAQLNPDTQHLTSTIIATVHAYDSGVKALDFLVSDAESIAAIWGSKTLVVTQASVGQGYAQASIALPEALPPGEDVTLTITRDNALACDATALLGFHDCGFTATASWVVDGLLLRPSAGTHAPSTVDLHVITPSGATAASQCTPKGSDQLADGNVVWHFHIADPTDFLGFSVGAYQPFDLPAVAGAAGQTDLPPMRVNLTGSYVDNAPVIGKMMQDVVQFYGGWFAGFPWTELQMNLLDDAFVGGNGAVGGMSHLGGIFASASLFSAVPTDSGTWLGTVELLAHEIGHQWWGNDVRPLMVGEVTLSESFAEFSSALYVEQQMQTRHLIVMDNIQYTFGVPTKNDVPLGSEAVFNSASYMDIVYHKGAVVIDMLRRQLGDAVMNQALHEWVKQYGRDYATIAELRAVMEQVSGQDLGWFFSQWYQKKGLIRAEVSGQFINDNGQWHVHVRVHQVDPKNIKRFLLTGAVYLAAGGDPMPFTMDVAEMDVVKDIVVPSQPVRVRTDWERYLLRQFATGLLGDTTLDGDVDGADFVDTALRLGRGVVHVSKKDPTQKFFVPDTAFNELFDLDASLGIATADLDLVEANLGTQSDPF